MWETTVSKADRIDIMMTICSGTISGLIDIFFIGDLSLDHAIEWGSDKVNKFVRKIAEFQGFKGGDLSDVIRFLEKKFGLAADSVTPNFGGGLQHHLRDFSHHFSIGGLLGILKKNFVWSDKLFFPYG